MTDEREVDPGSGARTPGFTRTFAQGRLTVGLFFPIEAFDGDTPTMDNQVELAQQAEAAGFAALWVRDVPLRDPSFGDVGQIYDPWVWLGFITAHTRAIALATGAIVLPLRHPLHVAKAAASVDNLSGGRLILGVASGDRPLEFPAFGKNIDQRGELFAESLSYIRKAWRGHFPAIDSPLGTLTGGDLVPKPLYGDLPIAITGGSQQPVEWIARHADAWMMYPRALHTQALIIGSWQQALAERGDGKFKPFGQSLYLDLSGDPGAAPERIHLGYRLGRHALLDFLGELQQLGVNHVALNLKYGRRPANEVLDELGRDVIPSFPHNALQNQG